jgi:hypothetical protein
MSSVIVVFAGVIFALGIALLVICRVSKKRGEEINALESSLESARDELIRQEAYQAKKEGIQKDADAKKESFHTGDPIVDFNNSLGLLHGSAGGGKTAPEP